MRTLACKAPPKLISLAAAASAVGSWLRGKGFTGIRTDPQRNYVRATGAVAAIDAAFRTQVENYRSSPSVNAGPYQLQPTTGR